MVQFAPGDAGTRERARMLSDIASLLDGARRHQGMTSTEWARRSRVSKRVVCYLVRGGRDLRLGTLLKLAGGVGWNLRVSASPRAGRQLDARNEQRPAEAGRQVERL